jgi:hypothetical protein
MCTHEWQKRCKVPGAGECPWCDTCKLCGITRIDTWKR